MDPSQAANVVRRLCPTIDLSETALGTCGKHLKDALRVVLKNARVLARHAKRSTITRQDVNQALGLLGHEPVYGAQRFEDQRLLSLEGKDVYFAEDIDVSAAEVNNVVLERPPADIQIHSHWLAVEGVQPRVPENEPPAATKEQKEATKRALPAKDASSRKRRNAVETVHPVTGGMVHGGVELRLPVEHALTAEQQAYFEQVQCHIAPIGASETTSDSVDEIEKVEEKLMKLQDDAALQPLVPYLIRFAEERVFSSMHDVWTLRLTLRVVHSLVRNVHIDLGLYSHHLLPLILSCLLSKTLGDSTVHHLGEACKVRDYAATVLASAVHAFDDSVSNVHCRVAQRLADCLEPEVSFLVKYGAVVGLDALGMTEVQALQELLHLCLHDLEEKLDDSHVASDSLSYHQGKTCVALIEDILARIKPASSPFQSPLQKPAKMDDAFV